MGFVEIMMGNDILLIKTCLVSVLYPVVACSCWVETKPRANALGMCHFQIILAS